MKLKVKFTDMPWDFDPLDNCYIHALKRRYMVEISDDPDIVFYSAFGRDFFSYPKSIRVFLANEPVIPNFNDCDYAVGWNDITFGGRYIRQPPLVGFGEKSVYELLHVREEMQESVLERKFCNFVYSNAANGIGAKLRIQFCKQLGGYKRIDCPGPVLNNMKAGLETRYHPKNKYNSERFNRDWARSKLDFLRGYKFTIAFENISLPGWTTEKLIHPLMANSIPIYWGNPNVSEYFNPKAFINCADYDWDLDAVMKRVIELDNDDDQYMEMLRQIPLRDNYPADWEEKLADFLAGIVESGERFQKNPLGYETMSAQDLGGLCREGKIGMWGILQTTAKCFSGWMRYKLRRDRE